MPSLEDAETRVLVVEDEPLLRMAAVDILEDAGFMVEEASDGIEALGILDRFPDLHVLFTDINMPGGIDGIALAHRIVKVYPAIGIVIVSSQPRPMVHEMPVGASFLAKPYHPTHMISHIRKAAQAVFPSKADLLPEG